MDVRISSLAGIAALRAGARISSGVRLARPGELRPQTGATPGSSGNRSEERD